MRRLYIFALSSILVLTNTVVAQAQSIDSITAQIVITELQTETGINANEEFIELTNFSNDDIALDGWSVQYRSATGTSWQDKALLSGTLYVGGSIVVSTQGYNIDNSTFYWSTSGGQLASTGGNIRIIAPTSIIAEDAVAWGTGIFGEGVPSIKATKGKSLHRRSADSKFIDTNNNADDFVEDLPDPTNRNIAPLEEPDISPVQDPTELPEEQMPEGPITEPPLSEQTPEIVGANPSPENPAIEDAITEELTPQVEVDRRVLLPIVINELMINPSPPLLDSSDEWIELYNPNTDTYELKDYKIQSGNSYSYSYMFIDEVVPPQGYLMLRSSQSGLALSNTSGAVRLLDESGAAIGSSVTYEEVEEGSTYALDPTGIWRWTTTPTLGAINQFTEAPILIKPSVGAIKKVSTPKASSAKAPTAKKSTATKASAKTTSVKAAKTAPESTTPPDTAEQAQKTRPLLLATFAVMAVLYGLYEYRDDASNSLWRARRYLEARRKNRQGL